LEADYKVIDIAHQSGFAPQPAFDHALEPEVEHMMEIQVAQQHADRAPLRSSLIAWVDCSSRLSKFGLALEPTKTKLVEFGRFAQRHAGKRGRNRPETIYFLGLTLYCTRNRKGNFKVGMRTEKSRLRRSLLSLQELMRRVRHHRIRDQVSEINAVLRGHYAYYGVAGNIQSLFKLYRATERYWNRMLCSRSRAASRLTWDTFNQIQERTPLLRPKLRLSYRELQALAVL